MGKESGYNELRRVVLLCMMMSMSILSILLIFLSFILQWEIWMTPVIIAGTAGCWLLFLMNRIPRRAQTYVCGFFGMFLVFFYCVKIDTIYDCGTVIVIMIFLFAFTRERALTMVGTISAFLSITFHLIVVHADHGLKTNVLSAVVRTVMVYVMIPFAVVLVEVIVRAWDASERNYEEKINSLSEENERANNFLANVSHEVRTPVSAVMGLSYVLQKENLPKEFREKIKAIAEAGQRVSEQITDILDFTEIEMKKVAVNNESYMMTSLLNDLLTQIMTLEKSDLDFVVDIDPSVPAVLVGDDNKIKRILWHLIRNGFKFTNEGGVYVRIYSVKREYGINLVMEVRDTGIGMKEGEIDNIYEKYYQADSGRARSKGGLGLGVSIVNGFVSALDGVFTIESKPNEGTVVRVSIPQEVEDAAKGIDVANRKNVVVVGFLGFMTTGHPKIREFYMQMITHLSIGLSIPFYRVQSKDELEKMIESTKATHLFVGTGEYLENREFIDSLTGKMNVALVKDRGFEEEVNKDLVILPKPFYGTQVANFLNHVFSTENKKEESISFPGLKALVVDDEHMNLIVAREIFKAYGMEITLAGGGEEAIELCKHTDFDIVFMDHMMPGMDGVEAMHRIKGQASKQNRELCVVALTANAISSAKEMFMAEGFDGFVSKPIEINELERVLKRVIPASKIVYTEDVPQSIVSKKQEPKPAEPADPLTVLKNLGVDTDYGLDYCGGDMDFYKELLLDYVDRKEEKLKEIDGYFQNEDWENYEIRVHGTKSTSALIGAKDLSEKAKQLEFASKKDSMNVDFIKENHMKFFEDYKHLLDEIFRLFGTKEEGGAA